MNAAVPVPRPKSGVCCGRNARRARRVRAYIHQPDDLAPLAALVRAWIELREAM